MQDAKNLGMTFDEAAKTFDYGRAVVMFQARLPVEFWKSMTTYQQVLVYAASATTAGNELAKLMFCKLSNTPLDFAGWKEIYGWAPPNSDLQALALTKMVEMASAPEQWEAVYVLGPVGGNHKAIALKKIRQLGTALREEVEAVD